MFELRSKIIDLLKESNLNIEALIFVVKDVLSEIVGAYNASISQKKEEETNE